MTGWSWFVTAISFTQYTEVQIVHVGAVDSIIFLRH